MRINGTELYVHEEGTGSPLVMLHGLHGNLTQMQAEIQRFSGDFRVIALDSRGHGRSERPGAYTLQDHVDDVIGLMDHLSIKQTALMGTSQGSYVAQGVASQQPQRVSKLVLITPKAHGTGSSVARFLAEHAAELRGRSPEQIRTFLMAGILAPSTPASVRASLTDMARQQAEAGLTLTPEQEQAASAALAGFDFRPVLPRVSAKTLVVSGRYDPLNPVESGEEVARLIPGARFVVMEHSGHAPTLEETDALLDVLEDFLKS